MKYVYIAAMAIILGTACVHKIEFKSGEKMVYTEPGQKGLMVSVNKTKVRKNEIHFDVSMQNMYEDQKVETSYESFTFKYNGVNGPISRNEFPPLIYPNQFAKSVLIFTFPTEIQMPGKGELVINLKLKDGKKLKPIKFDFDYTGTNKM